MFCRQSSRPDRTICAPRINSSNQRMDMEKAAPHKLQSHLRARLFVGTRAISNNGSALWNCRETLVYFGYSMRVAPGSMASIDLHSSGLRASTKAKRSPRSIRRFTSATVSLTGSNPFCNAAMTFPGRCPDPTNPYGSMMSSIGGRRYLKNSRTVSPESRPMHIGGQFKGKGDKGELI